MSAPSNYPQPKPERIEKWIDRVEIQASGCWQWPGALDSSGYGHVRYTITKGRQVDGRLHRVVYAYIVGPIPRGLYLDHLCRNRACCNPAHLEPVTNGENIRRGNVQNCGANWRAKTHCPQGHPYDKENTHNLPSGGRRCKECDRTRSRLYQRKKAAQRREEAELVA